MVTSSDTAGYEMRVARSPRTARVLWIGRGVGRRCVLSEWTASEEVARVHSPLGARGRRG